MQSNSNKEDLGWSGCASPSLPLLRCSWVACSQRQCCSPASQVGRGGKIKSDWKRITSLPLQTEQCTGSPSWCSVQVLSQLLMCKGWIKIIPKLLQNCLNVIPKLCPNCPKWCSKVVHVIPKWCQVVSMRNTIWSQDELSECHRSCWSGWDSI